MKNRKKEIILGIDPGVASVGFGLIGLGVHSSTSREPCLITYGVIRTKAGQSLAKRLEKIHQKLGEIIQKYRPTKIALEKIFFARNVKTAIQVGEARGVILYTIIKKKIPLVEFTPLQVKMAITGYGQADKKQIQKMVKNILKLKTIPQPDDAADALALALTCLQIEKFNKKVINSK